MSVKPLDVALFGCHIWSGPMFQPYCAEPKEQETEAEAILDNRLLSIECAIKTLQYRVEMLEQFLADIADTLAPVNAVASKPINPKGDAT